MIPKKGFSIYWCDKGELKHIYIATLVGMGRKVHDAGVRVESADVVVINWENRTEVDNGLRCLEMARGIPADRELIVGPYKRIFLFYWQVDSRLSRTYGDTVDAAVRDLIRRRKDPRNRPCVIIDWDNNRFFTKEERDRLMRRFQFLKAGRSVDDEE